MVVVGQKLYAKFPAQPKPVPAPKVAALLLSSQGRAGLKGLGFRV